MFDLMAMVFVVILFIIITMIILGLLVGKNPVITEFEARQRGIPIRKRSEEELRKTRERSDATTKTALGIFIVLALILVVVALYIYMKHPDLLVYTVPVFIAVGVLFLFTMMWLDEQRIKANYERIRIER